MKMSQRVLAALCALCLVTADVLPVVAAQGSARSGPEAKTSSAGSQLRAPSDLHASIALTPQILSVTPPLLAQGQTATLTLTTKNVNRSHQFSLGAGIAITRSVVSDGSVKLDVSVAHDAPAGPHRIAIISGNTRIESQAALVVTVAQQAQPGFGYTAPEPGVLSVSPPFVTQGQAATVRLVTRNVSKGHQFSFGEGITVTGITPLDGAVSLNVTVAASAPLGQHRIVIVDRERKKNYQTPAFVTVNAGAVQPQAVGTGITQVTPNQWVQAGNYAVVIVGTNLTKDTQLQFGPGVDQIGPLVYVSPTMMRATLQVAANAQPGQRFVQVRAADAQQWAQTSALVFVTAMQQVVLKQQVFEVVPNAFIQGTSYQIALKGSGFMQDMEVRLGDGIEQKGSLKVQSTTDAVLDIAVAQTALTGERQVQMKGGSSQSWSATPAMVTVYPVTKPMSGQAQMPPKKGKIELLTPQYGEKGAPEFHDSLGSPLFNDGALFTWKEQNPGIADYYEWRIYNTKGTLLKTVMLSGRDVMYKPGKIMHLPPPTSFRPSSELLKELLDPIQGQQGVSAQTALSGNQKKSNGKQTKVSAKTPMKTGAQTQSSSEGPCLGSSCPPETAFMWEVAGFKLVRTDLMVLSDAARSGMMQNMMSAGLSLNKQFSLQQTIFSGSPSGGGAGQHRITTQADLDRFKGSLKDDDVVAMEVEISDRWPLSAPDKPHGLACGEMGFKHRKGQENTVFVQPMDKEPLKDKQGKLKTDGEGNNIYAPENYTGDSFKIQGQFVLEKPPYKPQGVGQQSNTAAEQQKAVQACQAAQEEAQKKSGKPWCPPSQSYPSPNCIIKTLCSAPPQQGNVPSEYTNIILDWGDGEDAVVQPLKLTVTGQSLSKGKYGSDVLYTYAFPAEGLKHQYKHHGTYNVRLYMLGNDDLQKVNPDTFTQSSVDAKSKGGAPFWKALGRKASSPMKDIAERGYLIYCNRLDVREREDPASTGDLKLKSIRVTDFPGHNPAEKAACSASLGSQEKKGRALAPQADRLAKKKGADSAGKRKPSRALGAEEPAVASTCDSMLVAAGEVEYQGWGTLVSRWYRDGIKLNTEEAVIGPSEARHDLTKEEAEKPSTLWSVDPIPNSNNLLEEGKKSPGTYAVTAAGMARQLPASTKIGKDLAKALSADESGATFKKAVGSLGQQTAPGGKLFKAGFLRPTKQAISEVPTVTYFPGMQAGLSATKLVDLFNPDVTSAKRHYKIVAADPKQICMLRFPTADGKYFIIDGLQGSVVKSGTKYSGCGSLNLKLNTRLGDNEPENIPMPLQFSGWDIPDGQTVAKGTFSITPAEKKTILGMDATIDSVSGEAGKTVDAALTLVLPDTLREENVEKPYTFKGVKAPITPDGDWYAEKIKLPNTFIGWSGFKMWSDSITIDLSRQKSPGSIHSKCGSGGNAWIGMHLGTLSLKPNMFDLVGSLTAVPTVSDWAVKDGLVCGQTSIGPFDATMDEGTFHWDSVDVTAQNGNFDADYKNLRVHVPWLDADLTGHGTVFYHRGGDKGATFAVTGKIPPKDYGVVKMSPVLDYFGFEKNIGWATRTNTHFDFSAEGKQFAAADVNGLFFDMSGKAYFSQGTKAHTQPLSGNAMLSRTPLTLVSLDLNTAGDADDRIRFGINTTVKLSKVLPSSPMLVNYAIKRQGLKGSYFSTGPVSGPFSVKVGFPEGQPVMDASIDPVWSGSNKGAALEPAVRYARIDSVASDTDPIGQSGQLLAQSHLDRADMLRMFHTHDQLAAGSGDGDQFSGSIDIGMFGGPPIKAEFRLGYLGGEDYWLTRATVGLGTSGVTLTPFMSLYAIRGGLGYNFPIDAFKNASSLNAVAPDMSGSHMFMAGMRVGSPDSGFIYSLDGDFIVRTSGDARMEFRAWLLSGSHEGEGNFHGFFQYGGGSFDGMLSGKLSVLGDLIYMEIPENAATLHFGSDYWKITAGKKEGPRIKQHLIFTDTNGYFTLGSDGVTVGGGQAFNMSAAIGRLTGSYDIGVAVAPGPVVLGYAEGTMAAEICAFGACIGPSANVGVSISAPPPKASAHACFSFDFGLWEPEVCGSFSM